MTSSLQTVDMSNADYTVVSDGDDRIRYFGTWETKQIQGIYKRIHGTEKVGDNATFTFTGM